MMVPSKHLQIALKSPFNHLVELGYVYLASLSLLYLACTVGQDAPIT